MHYLKKNMNEGMAGERNPAKAKDDPIKAIFKVLMWRHLWRRSGQKLFRFT